MFPLRRFAISCSLPLRRCNGTTTVSLGKLGIIGGGRMAEAMLRCLAKTQDMGSVHVYDPSTARVSVLKARYGITPVDSADEAIADAEFVVLAVKPQHCQVVAESLTSAPKGWLVSVMAGISMAQISELFETEKIVRCMPNTPAV